MGKILPYKVGTCKECNRKDAKLIGGYCFEQNFCYQKRQQARYQEKQKSKEPKKKIAIARVSEKELKRLAKYRVARKEYITKNPKCEFPGCESLNVELHHGAGRIGDLLFNKKYFKSLCGGLSGHHQFCENNPAEAQRLGLSFKRLSSNH